MAIEIDGWVLITPSVKLHLRWSSSVAEELAYEAYV